MVKLVQTFILLCFVSVTSGWIRFRYPLSRRNFLQQTAMEMLQNCGRNPEEMCGVCGEGPSDLPTEMISTKDFQLVNVSDGRMDVGLGFRMNMQGFFEIRLCNIGPNSVANAEYCRKVVPLRIANEYQYIPGREQTSARLQIIIPPEAACERCVLQVKYIPGIDSRLAGQIFFDCALLRIPPSPSNLKMAGRILMSTDSPLKTTPGGVAFSSLSEVPPSDVSGSTAGAAGFSGSSTTAKPDVSRFTDLPRTASTSSNRVGLRTNTVTDASGWTNFQTEAAFKSTSSPWLTGTTTYPTTAFSNSLAGSSFETGPRDQLLTMQSNMKTQNQGNTLTGTKRQTSAFENVFTSETRFSDRSNNRDVAFVHQEGAQNQAFSRNDNIQTNVDVAMVQLPAQIHRTPGAHMTEVSGTSTFDSAGSRFDGSSSVNISDIFADIPETTTYTRGQQVDRFGPGATLNEFVETRTVQTSTDTNVDTLLTIENSTYTNSIESLVNKTTMPVVPSVIVDMTTQSPFNDTNFIDSVIRQGFEINSTTHNSSGENTLNATTNKSGDNWWNTYDTVNTGSSQTSINDYYYDYYTYSEIPANETLVTTNKTSSGREVSRNGTTPAINESTTYPFNIFNTTMPNITYTDGPTTVAMLNITITNITYPDLTTTPMMFNATLPNITYTDAPTTTESQVVDVTGSSVVNDTFMPFTTTEVPFISNYTTPQYMPLNLETTTTQGYITDGFIDRSFDITTTQINNIHQSSLDTAGNDTTELPLIVNTVTAVPFSDGYNITTSEVLFNTTLPIQNNTLNGTVDYGAGMDQHQQIVVVPDSLFDRVLFPVPKPDQDIVKVPDKITVFPTKQNEQLLIENIFSGRKTTPISIIDNGLRVDQQQPSNTPNDFTTASTIDSAIELNQAVNSNVLHNGPSLGTASAQLIEDTTNFDIATNAYNTYPDALYNNANNTYFTTNISVDSIPEMSGNTNIKLSYNDSYLTYLDPIPSFVNNTSNLTYLDPVPSVVNNNSDLRYLDPVQSFVNNNSNLTYLDPVQSFVTNNSNLTYLDPVPSVVIPLLVQGGSVIESNPFVAATDKRAMPNNEVKTTSPIVKTSSKEREYQYTDTNNPFVIKPDVFPTTQTPDTTGIPRLTDAEQRTLLKHTEDVIKAFVGRSGVANDAKSTVRAVFPKTEIQTTPIITASHFNDAVSYLPDVGGNADGIGGIPIHQGMFIDLFIPKFDTDTKTSPIKLEKVDSTRVLSNTESTVDNKTSMDLFLKGLKDRDSLSSDIKSANKIMRKSTPEKFNYVTEPTLSFGQFTKLTVPTSTDSWIFGARSGSNKINEQSEQERPPSQFSNFIPISNKRGMSGIHVENKPEIFFNSLDAPDIMPPIFVPGTKTKKSDSQKTNQMISFGIDNLLAPPPIPTSMSDKRVLSNTIWKGPGVYNAQGFGLISEPSNRQGASQIADNLKGANEFYGVTGPVYIPINEISIPLKEDGRLQGLPKSISSSNKSPDKEKINTTFSTLWDLNRLNRNVSKQRTPSTNSRVSFDQVMPPYIGIPLVMAENGPKLSTNNQQNWNDLPVPDIMPPIKVKLLNMTSKGTFVDNQSSLNQTQDLNQRILKKLEAIVGELQRNSDLLTQTLDVSPAVDQGDQPAFDRFPSQFTAINSNSNKPPSSSWFGRHKSNLLSEVFQQPISKSFIGHDNTLSARMPVFNIQPYTHNDPRGNAPISEANIGSSMASGNYKLLNMLGISDLRPLEYDNTHFNVKLNATESNFDAANQTTINQTTIDTNMLGNDTFTQLTDILKTLMTNSTNTTPTTQFGTALSTLVSRIGQVSTPRMLSTSWLTDANTALNGTEDIQNVTEVIQSTTDATWAVVPTTKQVVINVTNLNSIRNNSAPTHLPFVTSSNQHVVVPTGYEMLEPFAGTNISLQNSSYTDSENITSSFLTPELTTTTVPKTNTNSTMMDIVSTLNNTTTAGQIVVAASTTIRAVNTLKQAKVLQRNMTTDEKRRDTLVRSNFNSRARGLETQPKPTIAFDDKYYVGGMRENELGRVEKASVHTDTKFNALAVGSKPSSNKLPRKVNRKTTGFKRPVQVSPNSGFSEVPIDTNALKTVSGHARTNFILNNIPAETNILNQIPVHTQTNGAFNKLPVQGNQLDRIPFRATTNVVSNKFPLEISVLNRVNTIDTSKVNKIQTRPVTHVASDNTHIASRTATATNDINSLVRKGPATNQFQFPSMQLSEFSVAPLVNGEVIKVTEQPMKTSVVRTKFFGQNDLLNSIVNDELSTRSNGVRNTNTPDRNMVTNKLMSDSAFAKTNILSQGVDSRVYANDKPAPSNSAGYTDNFSDKLERPRSSTYPSSSIAPSPVCPEGQMFVCKAVGDYSTVPGMHWWCFSHCKKGACPDEKCKCACEAEQYETTVNTVPVNSERKARERKVIQLTLNGSEETKVPLSASNTEHKTKTLGTKNTGSLVITQYGTSEQIGPAQRDLVVQSDIGRPRVTGSTTSRMDGLDLNKTVRQVKLNCKGINAFSGKPEIDRWCTRMCNRNVCPSDLCLC